jgi:Flp pilus assembly protein TadB
MSKERQRARAVREAERRQAKAKAAKAAERKAKLDKVTPSMPSVPKRQPVYRQRRFPPLPWRLKLALAVGWAALVVVILLTIPTWTARIGFIAIATMLVPLIIVITTDPTRRYR